MYFFFVVKGNLYGYNSVETQKEEKRRKKIIIKSFSFLGKCAEGETNMCVWLNNNAASATRETRKCKFFFLEGTKFREIPGGGRDLHQTNIS